MFDCLVVLLVVWLCWLVALGCWWLIAQIMFAYTDFLRVCVWVILLVYCSVCGYVLVGGYGCFPSCVCCWCLGWLVVGLFGGLYPLFACSLIDIVRYFAVWVLLWIVCLV